MKLPTVRLAYWIFLALVLVVALPLAHSLYVARLYAEALHEREVAELARRLHAALDSINERVEHARGTLESLAQSEHAQTGDWRGLYEHAQRVVQHDRLLDAITLVDAETRLIFGTPLPFGSEHPMAAQPDAALAVLKTGKAALSASFPPPLQALHANRTGWLVAIGIPVTVSGRITHVLRGIIRCESLRAGLLGKDFPNGWLGSITDRQGNLIARTIAHDEMVGKPVIPDMVAAIRSHRSDAFLISSREGTMYLAQIGFLHDGDWSVQIGAPAALLAAPTHEAMTKVGVFYALMLLGILFAGWLIASHLGRRMQEIVELAKNPTDRRPAAPTATHIRELDQLHGEFTTLARTQRQLLDNSRSRESLLKLFIEQAPVAIAMLDRELNYLAVSRRWREDFSIFEKNVVGLAHDAVIAEIPERWRASHRRALAGETVSSPEDHWQRADGSSRWVRREVLPWREGSGEVGGIIIFLEDITSPIENRKALQQLNATLEQRVAARTEELAKTSEKADQQRRRFMTILDTMPVIVDIIRADHRIEWANRAYHEAFGDNTEKICYASQFGRDAPCEECEAFVPLATGQPHHWQCTLPSGRTYDIYSFPFVAADGSPAVLEMNIDITEQRQARAELLALNETLEARVAERTRELHQARAAAETLAKVKGVFLANMSHEIRTPLNGVLGPAQLGYRNSIDRPEVREMFGRILDSAKLLIAVIDDILDFSKIEAGKLRIEMAPIAPAALVDEAVRHLQANAESKGLRLLSEKIALPACCLGDPVRISQILLNLLSNAVKFTQTGEVRLRANGEDGVLRFDIIDTGIGISPEQQERLFLAFSQADASTTRKFGGTGLGLVISRKLAELMDGRLTLTSRLGTGSMFTLELPLKITDQPPLASGFHMQTGDHRLQGLRVLVAEDNRANQLVLQDMLTGEGAMVTMVANGRQAIEAIARATAQFDVVLTDIQMPEMDGIEAARRLRESHPALPIIGQTAHAFKEERDKCLAAGMLATVTKPIVYEELVSIILAQVNATRAAPAASEPPAAAPASVAIDWQAFRTRYPNRPDFIARLANIGIETHGGDADALRSLIDAGNLVEISKKAHALKGFAGNVFAPELSRIAMRVMASIRATSSDALPQAGRLAEVLEQVIGELTRHCVAGGKTGDRAGATGDPEATEATEAT